MVLIPTSSVDDWRKLLADPDTHWKPGYSAHALASRWESYNGFPPEIRAVLETEDAFKDIELLLAIPEHKVPLPGGRRASQTDLWALARTQSGLVSIAVEGKVGESFGPILEEWMTKETPGRRERWSSICALLEISPECNRALRYQLMHRTASALLEAKRFFAPTAVLLVHSFSATQQSLSDFQQFAQELGAVPPEPGMLADVGPRSGIQLFLGWAKGPPA